MSAILPWLLSEAWPVIVAVGAALVGLVAAWRHGSKKYEKGASDERAKHHADAIEAGRIRAEVDSRVDRLPDGAAADELRKHWSRD